VYIFVFGTSLGTWPLVETNIVKVESFCAVADVNEIKKLIKLILGLIPTHIKDFKQIQKMKMKLKLLAKMMMSRSWVMTELMGFLSAQHPLLVLVGLPVPQ
jgi:hypothetical protein